MINKICFIHSFKVGGTSFREFLVNNFDLSQILGYDFFSTSFEYVSGREIQKCLSVNSQINLVFGHLKNWHSTEVSKKFQAISMVREPISRLVSRYNHLRITPYSDYIKAPMEQRILIDLSRKYKIKDLVRIQDENVNFNFCNHQYKMLTSNGILSYDDIWNTYEVIGVLDNFADFCEYLSFQYNFMPQKKLTMLNVGKYQLDICNQTRSILEERNILDMELYHEVKSKW